MIKNYRGITAISSLITALFFLSIVFYGCENQKTIEKITALLNTGDIETARRIAHTLRSNAGYLGKQELQKAAFLLEQALQKEVPSCSPEQLATLDRELSSALSEFGPLLETENIEKVIAVQIESEQLLALLKELEHLLRKGDFKAVSYVERLQGIAGMAELAECIDEYDFEGALKLVDVLIKTES